MSFCFPDHLDLVLPRSDQILHYRSLKLVVFIIQSKVAIVAGRWKWGPIMLGVVLDSLVHYVADVGQLFCNFWSPYCFPDYWVPVVNLSVLRFFICHSKRLSVRVAQLVLTITRKGFSCEQVDRVQANHHWTSYQGARNHRNNGLLVVPGDYVPNKEEDASNHNVHNHEELEV